VRAIYLIGLAWGNAGSLKLKFTSWRWSSLVYRTCICGCLSPAAFVRLVHLTNRSATPESRPQPPSPSHLGHPLQQFEPLVISLLLRLCLHLPALLTLLTLLPLPRTSITVAEQLDPFNLSRGFGGCQCATRCMGVVILHLAWGHVCSLFV
jgi:hypothetical protein